MTLFDEACAAREKAYAPYSGFRVGAVLEMPDGTRIPGCNIENLSYSMTICAERCAVCTAIAAGRRSFRKIAIAGGRTEEEARETPCYPCGACLQVLSEFCSPHLPILLADGVHLLNTLYPNAFRAELGQK